MLSVGCPLKARETSDWCDFMIRSTLAAFADSISIPARKRSGPLTFTPNRVKVELLAGLTVALALVPEAVAFAFVAGVEPLVGLYAAFIVASSQPLSAAVQA